MRALASRKGWGMNLTLGGGGRGGGAGVLVASQACLFSSALSPFVSTASYQPPSNPYYYGEFPGSYVSKAQGPGPSASCLPRIASHRGQRVRPSTQPSL